MNGIVLAVLAGSTFWAWVSAMGAAPWPFDHIFAVFAVPLAVLFGMLLTLAITRQTNDTPP